MKSLRVPGLPGARRWTYRAAALVAAVLVGGGWPRPRARRWPQRQTRRQGVTMGAAAPAASSVYLAYSGTDGAVTCAMWSMAA